MSPRLRIAIPLLAQEAVMLGLLFFGWGFDDLRGFFAEPARVALIVLMLLGVAIFLICFPYIRLFQKGKQVAGRWQVGLLMVIMLLLLWFLPFDDRRGLWLIGGSNVPRYVGLGLVIAGSWLRLTGLRALGKQFSPYVTLQENHQLVQTGIYGIIRHPMYLGLLLSMPGFALVFRSWLALPVFIGIAVFLGIRIRQEETTLRQHFGRAFEAYQSRTWRLLPHVY
jgi:protein-S-isoprenylcysteine O-methyltransferase Ste14